MNSFCKFRSYLLCKEILFSLFAAVIFNSIAYHISIFVSQNYSITLSFISIYYGAIVSFVAVYATIIAIITSLSQEFPFNISLKYIVNSRLSLSYLLIIGLNIVLAHTFFLNSASANFENIFLVSSTVLLFLYTIIFVLSLINKFKIENHIRSFFADMIHRYSGDFSNITLQDTKNYTITDNDGFFIVKSRNFEENKEEIISENIVPKNISYEEIESSPLSMKKVPPTLLPVYLGNGKVHIENWKFMDNLPVPVNLRINKYEFGDNVLNSQVLCEYYPPKNDENIKIELEKAIKQNITYKDFSKEEFKEVFDKLVKNGTEQKIIIKIKDYIAQEDNLHERRFLYSSFEEFFKESKFNRKMGLDIEELLEVEISDLYEQKALFFKSPAIVAKLQDRLTSLLIRNFRKYDYFSPQLNTSGLYIKEFLDVRYKETYIKSYDIEWIREYKFLITNTITNIFNLCLSITELYIKDDLKQKYLVAQLGYLNQVLDNYKYVHETDFLKEYYDEDIDKTKKNLINTKFEFIRGQQNFLKEKQSDLFYIILYKIDEKDLCKGFFDIALKIYNLEGFENQYYKYERFDKLDWLNYDWFSGGAQISPPFNFNKYKLLISFYKFVNDGEVIIEKFENEYFTDSHHSFEKELDHLTKEFISKYFDYENECLKEFKEKVSEKIEEKKTLLNNEKLNYIITAPLKEEYVKEFISDCKKEWKRFQEEILRFMELEEIKNEDSLESFFGQYFLYDKELLIDPFEKNTSLPRDFGKHFGQLQGNSKLEKIINSINETFDENKDKEFHINNIRSDLLKVIEQNKDYYLFYNSNFRLDDIPNVNWNKKGIETASLVLNNTTIHLFFSNNSENLLFEEKAFLLEQYKQGYGEIEEILVVQIETIEKKEEIDSILNKGKTYKTEEEVKQKVKVRIAEKFNVKRNKDSKLIKLKIVD